MTQVRLTRVLAGVLVVLAACTSTPPPPSERDREASPASPAPPGATVEPLALAVVATEAGPSAAADRSFLDGMRLAAAEVNATGGAADRPIELRVVDDEGVPGIAGDRLGDLVAEAEAAAVLVVGSGSPVLDLRRDIEQAGLPIVLLGGDLYSPRALFRQAFQASIPMAWQARALARYVARDRGYRRVVVGHEPGEDGTRARDALVTALRNEGLAPQRVFRLGPHQIPTDVAGDAAGAEAVVLTGSADGVARLAEALAALTNPPQLLLSAESLRADHPGELLPGTVAPGPYAWAAWADPIRRVHRFRQRFERAHGRLPAGPEQEGYDALHLLVQALDATGGRTGEPLIRRLERNRPDGPTFSSLPLVLGPDDHTLTDETFVGLFAVAGPRETVEPWVEGTPWRPIIRTFTSDGERTIFLERDRRAFFPFWRPRAPSPKFFRSRLGITTGRADPLH